MKWHCEKSPLALLELYGNLLPKLRRVARKSGYALGVHGSMRRDFDLIAVPWVQRAVKPFTLIDRLSVAITGLHAARIKNKSRAANGAWEIKPHGRCAITIPIGMNAIIDVSVVPFKAGGKA